ncbi:MAG: hypothetical protein WC641_05060 [Patescibacteria group bacterium]
MTDLNELFFKIQDARKREALPPPSTKLLARLQKAMKKDGTTTGDPIRDHVIKHWSADEDVETYIRELQAKLIGKIGQLCLVVYVTRTWEPRDRSFHTEINLHMCLLDAERVDLDDQFWVIQTKQCSSLTLTDSDGLAAKKPFDPHYTRLDLEWKWLTRFLPQPLNQRYNTEHDHGERKFELVCGDGAVEAWFETRIRIVEMGFMPDTWVKACRDLAVMCGCPEDKLPNPRDPFKD